MDESVKLGWYDGRASYTCWDGAHVHVPRRTANVRELDEIKTVPRSMIRYSAGKKELRIRISGVEFGRDMKIVFGGPDDIRTVIFPTMVKSIR